MGARYVEREGMEIGKRLLASGDGVWVARREELRLLRAEEEEGRGGVGCGA